MSTLIALTRTVLPQAAWTRSQDLYSRVLVLSRGDPSVSMWFCLAVGILAQDWIAHKNGPKEFKGTSL